MSRQAKIIIFSLILLFSIYNKQTSNDASASSVNTKVDKKPVKGIYDDLGLEEAKKSIEESEKLIENLGTEKNPLKWFPTPENGFSPYNQYFGKGIYKNNSGNEFVIKNSNKTDAVVLLVNAFTGRKVRNEFIRKGSNFKMTGVPNGTYYLEWFSGNYWSPELKVGSRFKGGFQTNASFTRMKDRSDWMSVDGYKQWTITLYTVAGGDVESKKINADEFFN